MKFLYKELGLVKDKWSPDLIGGIIMNTETGEILAMDSLPTYDPNKYKEYENKLFINPHVQNIYELGSIMKPITVAGGVENKLINPNTVYRDTGEVRIDDFTIRNFDKKAWGDTTIQTALSKSLNLGMVYIMRLMGFEKFRVNILNFKLGEETGIDLPGEVSNKLANIYGKTEVNYATTAFGQGVATTPISMLKALSSIGNNGKLTDPHIIKKQQDQDGNILDVVFSKDEMDSSISSTTSQTVKSMMVETLDSFGNGKYKDSKYKVGTKTGTGQIAKPGGGYYTDRALHSYFAFFPEKNTKFSILIYQVNPKRGEAASYTLTEPVMRIKDFLASYYEVMPDR
jgi:cell division protein FtsI/penicillin-binding protein 2